MRRCIELNQEQNKYLLKHPERGMGYHFVHITLKNGTTLKNRIVIHALHLLLEEGENFSADEIAEITIKENISMVR
jgi:hypothetical protein